MTKSTPMPHEYVNGTLPRTPPASTFALQMLRDRQKKLELAQRMYRLWEDSGYKQDYIADQIGLKHRSYQKALQTGGISFEKLQKLAELHEVDLDWLIHGDRKREEPASSNGTPDLMGAVDHEHLGITHLTQLVEQILDRLDSMDAKLIAATGERAELQRCLERIEARTERRANGGS